MAITHLLYLHGFRSSPLSAKAQRLAAWVRRHQPGLTWWCPQLPASPQAAATLITQGLRDWPTDHMAVVGSSLGGFYATWVAARWGCKAVLLNPAVDPARDLAAHIGVHPQWHQPQEQVFFQAAHVDELRALYVGRSLPLRTPTQVQAPELDDPTEVLAIVAQGDEDLTLTRRRQVFVMQIAFTLGRSLFADGEQARESAIGGAVLRITQHTCAVGQVQAAAHDKPDLCLPRCVKGFDDPRHAVAVRDRQGADAQ